VGMANIAQTVNVISPLMTTKNGVVKQATWWPLLLFSKYMRGWTVGVHVRGGAYDGETQPVWLQSVLEHGASWLDVSACVDEEGIVSLVVVNINEVEDFEAELKEVGDEVEVYTISGPSVKAVNVDGKEQVGVKESKWDGTKGKYKFEKHSITMLRWHTKQKITEVSKGDGTRLDTRKLAWDS